MTYHVRRAETRDLVELIRLRAELLQEVAHLSARQLAAHLREYKAWLCPRLKRKEVATFVAEKSGVIMATGSVWAREAPPLPGIEGVRSGYVFSMYVRPDFRRKGLGDALLRATLEWATHHGCRRLTLHTTTPAQDFYRNRGFIPTEELGVVFRRTTRREPRR